MTFAIGHFFLLFVLKAYEDKDVVNSDN